jgi:serine/threonine protein kinase
MALSRCADSAPPVRSRLTNQLLFLHQYENLNTPLGRGSYGTVSLWKCRQSHEERAIKVQSLRDASDMTDWQREEWALHTAAASSDPDSRHIVKIYASCLTGEIDANPACLKPAGKAPQGKYAPLAATLTSWLPRPRLGYLVMEYCGLTLSDALRQHPGKPLPECLKWSIQLFCGLTFIHSKGIIHRDIKPGNTLLIETCNGCWDIKIADLGSSREEAEVMTAAVVTLPYRAPEILLSAVTEQAGPPTLVGSTAAGHSITQTLYVVYAMLVGCLLSLLSN